MINNEQTKDVLKRIEDLYKYLQIEKKKIEIINEDEKTAAPEFWNDPKEAEVFLKQLRGKKRWVEDYNEIKIHLKTYRFFRNLQKKMPKVRRNWMKPFQN